MNKPPRPSENFKLSGFDYKNLFDHSNDAILVTNENLLVVDANAAACALFQYENLHDLIGQNVYELSPKEVFGRPRDETVAQFSDELKQTGRTRFRWIHLRRDGSEFPVEIAASVFVVDGQMFLFGTLRDISAQLELQRNQEALQKQLYESQKIESLGRLTGGIAHDFNNILAIIHGYTELAMRHAGTSDEKMKRYFQTITDAGNRAKDLVKQLLTFARGDMGQAKLIAADNFIPTATKLIRSSIPTTIDIQIQIAPEPLNIRTDPIQLHQALLNLAINAMDAIPNEKGHIYIRTKSTNVKETLCSSCQTSFSGEFVEISVEDDGVGIEPSAASRIFEPFFTTKEFGKGNGMGLAVVHGIVHGSGGHIMVEPNSNRGVTFRLFFPAQDVQASAPIASKPGKSDDQSKQKHILIVDDETMLGNYLSELLRSIGYQTTVYDNPTNALDYFRQNPDRFDLLLTDQTMPMMNGVELIRHVRQIKPKTSIILCTGYSNLVNEKSAASIGIDAFLEKPIDVQRLLDEVTRILEPA